MSWVSIHRTSQHSLGIALSGTGRKKAQGLIMVIRAIRDEYHSDRLIIGVGVHSGHGLSKYILIRLKTWKT